MLPALLVAAALQAPPAPDLDGFGPAEAERLRRRILPDEDELRWTEIPWIPAFHEGLAAADAAAKPVLLWVMNGHPLGCT